MARHDGFNDFYPYTPEPIREEDRATHKWPAGYWDKCDELLVKLRERHPGEYVVLVVREDGGFHVRRQRAGQVTTATPGVDRVEALQNALAGSN